MLSFFKSVLLMSFLLVQFDAAYAMQSLSIEWMKTESYLQGRSRNFFYEPESGSLYYQLTLNDSWSVGASLWRGSADAELDVANFRLKETHSGGALSVGYLTGNWGVNFAINSAESDIDVRSPTNNSFYEEQTETRDITLTLDYSYQYRFLDILPSLGLGWQQSDSRYAYFGANLPLESFTSDEQQTNLYAFAGLNVGSSFELNASSLLAPSLQISWTENLDGDAEQTETSVLNLSRRNYAFTRKTSSNFASPDGSGYVVFALMCLVDDYWFRVSHSKTFELDINYDASSLELGMTF